MSSRSHSVLIIVVNMKLKDGSVRVGKLNLADLAGSERIERTNATGNTLEEAKKINQSLSALGSDQNNAHGLHLVPHLDERAQSASRPHGRRELTVSCSSSFCMSATVSLRSQRRAARTFPIVIRQFNSRCSAQTRTCVSSTLRADTLFGHLSCALLPSAES